MEYGFVKGQRPPKEKIPAREGAHNPLRGAHTLPEGRRRGLFSVHIAPGGNRKTLPYLRETLKKAAREGQVDAALCAGPADLLIVPRGAAAGTWARCRLTVGADPAGGGEEVTCGLGADRDLSLSSIREDGAMLSLRRDLRALDGSLLEAQEIPVSLAGGREPEPEALLAAAGAMLLLGADTSEGLRL